MYFHTIDNIYLTYFNNEIIALDLKKDQYMILSDLSEALYIALNNKFTRINDTYHLCGNEHLTTPNNFDAAIKYLREIGVLSNYDYNHPSVRIIKKNIFSAGAPNIDWRLPADMFDYKIPIITTIEAYLMLAKVYFIINFYGFIGLIKSIKNKRKRCIKKDAIEFNILVAALNRACFYFPVKTKCLEWSSALIFMGLRRKWECNLEIGVQNYPFAAHAWVKADNKVIADIESLPKTLSVILSEPFSDKE